MRRGRHRASGLSAAYSRALATAASARNDALNKFGADQTFCTFPCLSDLTTAESNRAGVRRIEITGHLSPRKITDIKQQNRL
jgi:hypothetical protein